MFASRSVLASAFALLASLTTTVVSAGQTPDGVFDGNGGSLKIDYQPPFTSPEGGEVWFAGMSYSASWKQELPENIPLENVSKTADLVMGYKTDGESSLHLTWTLAEDIPLYASNPGSVDFTLPADLETRDSYFLVLLGSTHNQSPEFTVVANPVADLLSGSGSSSSSSSPSSASSSSRAAPSSTTSSAAPAAITPAAAAAGAPADSLPFRRRSANGKFRLVARK